MYRYLGCFIKITWKKPWFYEKYHILTIMFTWCLKLSVIWPYLIPTRLFLYLLLQVAFEGSLVYSSLWNSSLIPGFLVSISYLPSDLNVKCPLQVHVFKHVYSSGNFLEACGKFRLWRISRGSRTLNIGLDDLFSFIF